MPDLRGINWWLVTIRHEAGIEYQAQGENLSFILPLAMFLCWVIIVVTLNFVNTAKMLLFITFIEGGIMKIEFFCRLEKVSFIS